MGLLNVLHLLGYLGSFHLKGIVLIAEKVHVCIQQHITKTTW